MLVLSRRVDEKFRLIWANGMEAKVTIQRIGQTRVLVGIDAPRGVTILRDELDLRDEPDPGRGNLLPGGQAHDQETEPEAA